jgi:hypothetical protein
MRSCHGALISDSHACAQGIVETLQPLSGPRAGAALRRAFTELFRVYVDALCRAFEEHQSADGPFNEMLGETPQICSRALSPPEEG